VVAAPTLKASAKGEVLRAPKSAPWKVRIARELRSRSTATNAWIAERLAMGHPTRVCNLIRNGM
jgi:hypothetical protein